jgi:hypothetical protein
MNVGGGVFTSMFGGNVTVNGKHISDDGGIYINGTKYVKEKESSSHEQTPKDPTMKRVWEFDQTILVSQAEVQGGTNVSIDSDALDENIGMSISGSGTINTPRKKLSTASVDVSGSGKAVLGGSEILGLNVNVSGSGSVSQFYVSQNGNFCVSGSGTINGKRLGNPMINKSVSGSGGISV